MIVKVFNSPSLGTWELFIDDEDSWILSYGLGLWTDHKRKIPYVVFQNSKRNKEFRGKKISRVIMNCPETLVVDHIDGNPMNNCKSNLRVTEQKHNNKNASKRKNSKSLYKGVSPKKNGTFTVKIQKDNKTAFIGKYKTELEAAKAYDKKAKELFGEFARLNFPGEAK